MKSLNIQQSVNTISLVIKLYEETTNCEFARNANHRNSKLEYVSTWQGQTTMTHTALQSIDSI